VTEQFLYNIPNKKWLATKPFIPERGREKRQNPTSRFEKRGYDIYSMASSTFATKRVY
jgi:hypothetical protein